MTNTESWLSREFKNFGLSHSYLYLLIDRALTDSKGPYISISRCGNLRFDVLAKISEMLKTKNIDLDCDLGCSSDPSHERTITIYDFTLPEDCPK